MKLRAPFALAACSTLVSAIKYANVRIEHLAPEFRNPESPKSSRLQVKYGPYQLTPDKEDEVSVLNWKTNATKPCSGCVLKYAAASLVYQDGKAATAEMGINLDSLVLSIEGEGRKDVACDSFSQGERILIVDNNRQEVLYGLTGSDEYGVYLSTEDKMSIHVEMSNVAKKNQDVYLQLVFEYQPGKPANHKSVKAAWFDAEPCGAKPFTSPYGGKWVAMMLHEMAPDLELIQNGYSVCETQVAEEAVVKQFSGLDATTKYMRCQPGSLVKAGDRIALKTSRARDVGTSESSMGLLAID